MGNNQLTSYTVTDTLTRGVGTTGDARPRNVETTGARASFRPRNIFPHFCTLFLKLPLFVVMLPTYN